MIKLVLESKILVDTGLQKKIKFSCKKAIPETLLQRNLTEILGLAK